MKYNLILICLFLIICSCAKDDSINTPCEADINTPTGNNPNKISTGKTLGQGSLFNECVSTENITSTFTDFIMLDKGLQELGSAKGIKINENWEASVFMYHNDTSFRVIMKTYWTNYGSYINGEFFRIGHIPKDNPIGCYNLSSITSSADSIYCQYKVDDFDINLVQYILDESKENKLEILEYDPITGLVRGKFKASFITDEPEPGYFPEEVRFFNVNFETY